MKLTTVFSILIITAIAGVGIYIIGPTLTQKTYEGRVFFNVTDETNFEGKGFYITGSTVGSFEVELGDTLSVTETGNPCGSSCIQYHYALLIDLESGEVADISKLTIVTPSKLEPPHQGTYAVTIGVVKNILYEPKDSIGYWDLEITVKKGF